MTYVNIAQDIQKHIPLVGDINTKSPLAYQLTRGTVEIANTLQMAVAEAYINGLEAPDYVVQGILILVCQSCFSISPRCLHLMTGY